MDRVEYFSSSDHKNTREVLQKCPIFVGATNAIDDAIKSGKYESYGLGESFIEQNAKDKSVYIILDGEVDILVNGRGVARRSAPSHVGEMAVIDPTAKRSATVTPVEECIVLKIEENEFLDLGNNNPRIWRNIAAEISSRLRQRGELVDTKESTPRLFIGSSAEYLQVAYAIQEGLLHTEISVNVWSQDCFRPSDGTLAALEREAKNSDFALFIFGNEDLLISRDKEQSVPRDNVIFELGLFSGRLSSERVYFAQEIGVDIKIPTDLAGITPIKYKRKEREELSISVQPICNKLVKRINELGTK
jgi:CRP/FNR family transcriptional regulator, cyclic AMP receptor protein